VGISSGQLGTGGTQNQVAPVPVGTATWKAISAGRAHTCAIRVSGSLWCWGYNSNGQLGDGTTSDRRSPVQVGSASWKSVAAATSHTCAIRADDTLWCWGSDSSGQIVLAWGTGPFPVWPTGIRGIARTRVRSGSHLSVDLPSAPTLVSEPPGRLL
jgi:alpha-tubulin suppressor-like RCC1 family protein